MSIAVIRWRNWHSLHHRKQFGRLYGIQRLVLGGHTDFNQLRSGRFQQFFGFSHVASLFCLDRHYHADVGLEYGQHQRLSYSEPEHDVLGGLHHGQRCDRARDGQRSLSGNLVPQHLDQRRGAIGLNGQSVSCQCPGKSCYSVYMTLAAATTTGSSLAITTTSLTSGQVGTAYSATLAATGGTTPYTWSLTSGTLPAGLTLNATTGAITGTPTATANATSLTFKVTDSSSPVQTKSVTLSLTVTSSGSITVSVSPLQTGISIHQTLSLTATTTDSAGVNWSVTGSGCSGTGCGTFSSTTSLTGVAATYTPPTAAGVYTVTATSVTNNSITASATVGVTDLAGVTTYHNDLARDGANTQEYALNTSNVNSTTFGKLFSCTVDQAIYAQPLWLPNVSINSVPHNVVVVATQNDSVYAFDADTSPCVQLWHTNLLDTAHGANSGEAAVPSGLPGYQVGMALATSSPW